MRSVPCVSAMRFAAAHEVIPPESKTPKEKRSREDDGI